MLYDLDGVGRLFVKASKDTSTFWLCTSSWSQGWRLASCWWCPVHLYEFIMRFMYLWREFRHMPDLLHRFWMSAVELVVQLAKLQHSGECSFSFWSEYCPSSVLFVSMFQLVALVRLSGFFDWILRMYHLSKRLFRMVVENFLTYHALTLGICANQMLDFSGASVTGLNNNDTQIARGKVLNFWFPCIIHASWE